MAAHSITPHFALPSAHFLCYRILELLAHDAGRQRQRRLGRRRWRLPMPLPRFRDSLESDSGRQRFLSAENPIEKDKIKKKKKKIQPGIYNLCIISI